jgi:hypothetical protein
VGLRPQLFAYQFVLRLQPHAAGVDVAVFEAPGTLTEILQESAKETGVPVVPAEPRALTPFS